MISKRCVDKLVYIFLSTDWRCMCYLLASRNSYGFSYRYAASIAVVIHVIYILGIHVPTRNLVGNRDAEQHALLRSLFVPPYELRVQSDRMNSLIHFRNIHIYMYAEVEQSMLAGHDDDDGPGGTRKK